MKTYYMKVIFINLWKATDLLVIKTKSTKTFYLKSCLYNGKYRMTFTGAVTLHKRQKVHAEFFAVGRVQQPPVSVFFQCVMYRNYEIHGTELSVSGTVLSLCTHHKGIKKSLSVSLQLNKPVSQSGTQLCSQFRSLGHTHTGCV